MSEHLDHISLDKISTKLEILELQNNERSNEIQHVCHKLDDTISKLQELTLNITKMVTTHEQRIKQAEDNVTYMNIACADKHRDILVARKDLESKIQSQEIEMNNISNLVKNVYIELEKLNKSVRELADRIYMIDKFKYLIVGGAIVLGFTVDKLIAILAKII